MTGRVRRWLRRRRSAIVFVVLVVGLSGLNMLWTAHVVQGNNQQRCTSIEADARIPVPQPVAGNPSRLWEARFEAIERQRARNLHCSGN